MFNLRYCATQDKYIGERSEIKVFIYIYRVLTWSILSMAPKKNKKKQKFQGYELYMYIYIYMYLVLYIGRKCV